MNVNFEWAPLILAGGKGTRLGNKTRLVPKPLMKIKEKYFIEYLLDELIKINLKEVYVSIGYLAEEFRLKLGLKYKSIRIRYIEESQPLGTGGAIKQGFLISKKENLLVMNGDSFCYFNIRSFLKSYNKEIKLLMLLCKIKDSKRYGNVEIDENNKIINFCEKINKNIDRKSYINAGVYLISNLCLKKYNGTFSLEEDVFTNLPKDLCFGFLTSGKFIDIGTPESLIKASKFFDEL